MPNKTARSKKFAVLIIFGIIVIGLYFIKKELKSSPEASQFIILNWHHSPEKIILNDITEFTFHLKDKKIQPIENAQMQVLARMDHTDMIPIQSEATAYPNGFYKFHLRLNRHGNWILFLTIKKTDGTVVKKEIFFKTESK